VPIGNLTSQIFSNIYLNELDHYMKYTLKADYHIKYMDDFVILDYDKYRLKAIKNKLIQFLLLDFSIPTY